MSNLPPNPDARVSSLKHLFNGRKTIKEYDYPPLIYIGPVGGQPDEVLSVGVAEPIALNTTNGSRTPPTINWEEMEAFGNTIFSLVLQHLLTVHGVDKQIRYRLEGYRAAPKALNESEIEFRALEGVQNVRKEIIDYLSQQLKIRGGELKRLGVVVDADADCAAR